MPKFTTYGTSWLGNRQGSRFIQLDVQNLVLGNILIPYAIRLLWDITYKTLRRANQVKT